MTARLWFLAPADRNRRQKHVQFSWTVRLSADGVIARQMAAGIAPRALTHLDRHQIYATLSYAGLRTEPMRATTLPFFADAHPSAHKIRSNARRHFARERATVERMVTRQLGPLPKGKNHTARGAW